MWDDDMITITFYKLLLLSGREYIGDSQELKDG